MDKKLGFKDFLNVDYVPGMPDLIKKKAKKRKQEIGEEVELDEVLSVQQRLAVGRRMRINAPKINMGRKRALMRNADTKTLKNRSEKAARMIIFKKLAKGKSKDQVPPQQRIEIEKRMAKMTGRIQRLAIKLLPKMRERERDRHNHTSKDDKGSNSK